MATRLTRRETLEVRTMSAKNHSVTSSVRLERRDKFFRLFRKKSLCRMPGLCRRDGGTVRRNGDWRAIGTNCRTWRQTADGMGAPQPNVWATVGANAKPPERNGPGLRSRRDRSRPARVRPLRGRIHRTCQPGVFTALQPPATCCHPCRGTRVTHTGSPRRLVLRGLFSSGGRQ